MLSQSKLHFQTANRSQRISVSLFCPQLQVSKQPFLNKFLSCRKAMTHSFCPMLFKHCADHLGHVYICINTCKYDPFMRVCFSKLVQASCVMSGCNTLLVKCTHTKWSEQKSGQGWESTLSFITCIGFLGGVETKLSHHLKTRNESELCLFQLCDAHLLLLLLIMHAQKRLLKI